MRRVWLFCATLMMSAGIAACSDSGGDDTPEDCDNGEVLIDGACCIDDNNNGVCDDQEQTEEDCEDEEVLIDGVCCIDDNDNGVCDDQEQTEEDCEDEEVLIDGVCCIDADENDVCDADECEDNETWEDDACCIDANNNGICDDDEDPRTIHGKAIGNMGPPLEDATVYLNSDFDNGVTTDSEGNFSFDDVDVQYDLTIEHTNDLDRTNIMHHVGISADEPIISNHEVSALQSTQLEGQINLDEANFDSSTGFVALILGVEDLTGRTIHANADGDLTGYLYQWIGSDETTTTVKPLAVDRSDPHDVHFVQTGDAQSVDFTNPGPIEIEGLALDTDVEQNTVTIEPDGGGYSQVQNLLLREVIEGDIFYSVHVVPDLSILPDPVDFPILEDGGVVQMTAYANNSDYEASCQVTQIVHEDSEVIACPDEPVGVLTNLIDEQTDVPLDTTIEWSAVPDVGMYRVRLQPNPYNSGERAISFTLPAGQTKVDLSDFEDIITLQEDTAYILSVDAFIYDGLSFDDYVTDLTHTSDLLQTPHSNAVSYRSWLEFQTVEP